MREARRLVHVPRLGLVGSVVDELISILFLGYLCCGFGDLGVALLGEDVVSGSHSDNSPSVAALLSSMVSLVDGCVDWIVFFFLRNVSLHCFAVGAVTVA